MKKNKYKKILKKTVSESYIVKLSKVKGGRGVKAF